VILYILAALGLGGLFLTKTAQSAAESVVETVETHLDFWTQFDALFQNYGARWGVDWTWLKAIALNESDLGRAKSVARGLADPTDVPGSTSSDGKSWGLMQVTLTTARDLDASASEIKLNNPDYSVNLAAKYISQLKSQFNQFDPRFMEYVVKSYNQGPGNTRKEIQGKIAGYAQPYWERFQRNLQRVEDSL
jgi:soluble lytic murein transglycosylase-like protein